MEFKPTSDRSDRRNRKFIERARARVRAREWVLLWYVDSSSECVITVVIKYSLKLL